MTGGQSTGNGASVCDVAQHPPATAGRFQPPEVRRRQILDAAAALALEHGLDDVSIAQVAARAGIAKGSIYLHFASRHELVDALRADLWHEMLDEPRRLLGLAERSWADRMDRIVAHLVGFSVEHEDLYHAIFHATASHSDEPWTEARQLIRTLLDAGQRAAEFDLVDLDVTTDFLLHAYAGPCYHTDDIAHTTAQLQLLFRRSTGAPPPAPS